MAAADCKVLPSQHPCNRCEFASAWKGPGDDPVKVADSPSLS